MQYTYNRHIQKYCVTVIIPTFFSEKKLLLFGLIIIIWLYVRTYAVIIFSHEVPTKRFCDRWFSIDLMAREINSLQIYSMLL